MNISVQIWFWTGPFWSMILNQNRKFSWNIEDGSEKIQQKSTLHIERTLELKTSMDTDRIIYV